LPEHRNPQHTHRPHRATRSKQLQRESDLVEDDSGNRHRQKQQTERHQQRPQKRKTPEINDYSAENKDERETLRVKLSARDARPEREQRTNDRGTAPKNRRSHRNLSEFVPLDPDDVADNEGD